MVKQLDEQPKAFIFDLDGTVYLGDDLIPGAKETLNWVREQGAKVRFVTNNPRFSRDFYAEKLNNLGIKTTIDEIVTSGNFTASYLRKNMEKYGKVYIVGEEQLEKELKAQNIPLTDQDPDTVLVSFDTTLTYDKLMVAYHALRKGAHFISTNPDVVCPTPDGGLVDSGAIIAALEAATGREIEAVIGKPSTLLADLLVDELNVPAKKCVVVGDRLNTDVVLGKQSGLKAAWIRAHNEEIPEGFAYQPDFIIRSIAELPEAVGHLYKESQV